MSGAREAPLFAACRKSLPDAIVPPLRKSARTSERMRNGPSGLRDVASPVCQMPSDARAVAAEEHVVAAVPAHDIGVQHVL